jgi:hypothetical protein
MKKLSTPFAVHVQCPSIVLAAAHFGARPTAVLETAVTKV